MIDPWRLFQLKQQAASEAVVAFEVGDAVRYIHYRGDKEHQAQGIVTRVYVDAAEQHVAEVERDGKRYVMLANQVLEAWS